MTRREGLSPSHLLPPSNKRLWLPRPQNPTQLFIKDAQHAFRHTMLALQAGIVQHSYLVPVTSLCSADSPCKAPQSSLHGGAHAPSTVTNPVIQDPAAVTQLQRATNIRLQQTALLLNKAQHQPAESTRTAAEQLSALCTVCWVLGCLPVHSQLTKAVDACVVLSAESGEPWIHAGHACKGRVRSSPPAHKACFNAAVTVITQQAQRNAPDQS